MLKNLKEDCLRSTSVPAVSMHYKQQFLSKPSIFLHLELHEEKFSRVLLCACIAVSEEMWRRQPTTPPIPLPPPSLQRQESDRFSPLQAMGRVPNYSVRKINISIIPSFCSVPSRKVSRRRRCARRRRSIPFAGSNSARRHCLPWRGGSRSSSSPRPLD